MKPSLALFDFDGTITKKDTFLEFIKFYKGATAYYLGMMLLSPFLILFKLKIFPNWKAKEMVIAHFFKGVSLVEFQKICDDFALQVIPGIIRPKAIQKLKEHISQGDKVVIVSASAENWISAYIKTLEIDLIATKLEVKDGKITGKISGLNCYGAEKVNRIKAVLNKEQYGKIYAYGDSSGDKELLAFASERFYRHF